MNQEFKIQPEMLRVLLQGKEVRIQSKDSLLSFRIDMTLEEIESLIQKTLREITKGDV